MRGLRKQARKGNLTARERDLLLDQEKKFRKARRRKAPAVGAGLAGAAALLGTSAGQSLLENIGGGVRDMRRDALDARLDRRVARADARTELEREELARQEAEETRRREEEMGMRLSEGADRIEEEEREEDRQNLLARADEFERQEAEERERVTAPVTDVDFSMGEEGPTRETLEEFERLEAERPTDFSDPLAMGAARAMSRDAAADFGRAQFDRAQRILSGEELTGDPRIDLGVQPMDLAEEEDMPNEFFPLDQIYEARARSRYESEVSPENKGPMSDGGAVRSYARGGVSPMVNDLRRKIARKYGIK